MNSHGNLKSPPRLGAPAWRFACVLALLGPGCVGSSGGQATTSPSVANADGGATPQFAVDGGSSANKDAKSETDGAKSEGGSTPETGLGDSAAALDGTSTPANEAVGHADDDAKDDASAPTGAVDAANAPNCEKDKFCTEDTECPQTACAAGQCKGGCCIVAPVTDGKPCSDSNACTFADVCKIGVCTGTAKNCDDGKDCTADTCNKVNGKCVSTIADSYCLISGSCIAAGQTSQSSVCKSCDPLQATDSWTTTPNCCANDTECPPAGVCDKAVCDATTHTCGFEKKAGCCTADLDCNDGNACTKDSCDVATGACAYANVTCVDPNPCQAATCDAATGQCKPATKAGWCLIDGSCLTEGSANPANACEICNSVQSNSSWTPAVGSACNDSNPCTYDDTCKAGGGCAGTPKKGCCLSDADCAPSGDPCAANVCDAQVGVCLPKTVAGCCSSGTCCDAATNKVKEAKAACGGGAISIEYQCNGQAIQTREISPGCDGKSATGCSTQAAFLLYGPWQNVQTCPTNTVCKAAGSGQKPTCETTQPAGSCANSCGGQSATGACYCDAICTAAGDCCKDYMTTCGCSAGECCDVATKYPKAKGTVCGTAKTQWQCSAKAVQKRTGNPTCTGKNVCSSATADFKWGAWTTTQTCSSTQNCVAASDGTSASCKAVPTGTCMGHCGTKSAGACYCDTACQSLGDCCADFDSVGCGTVQSCGAVATTSCKGKCGGQGTGLCWCDKLCEDIGDCCKDKAICACQ